jgi:Fur family ferric uptake transcriptional regulator
MKKLKENGFKVTTNRTEILNFFEAHPNQHFSAEDIALHLENISLASVYRILSKFEKSKILIRHQHNNRHIFEINTHEHHDHLSCIKCHKVEEFTDDLIEEQQRIIAKKLGYEITHHTHHIYGICQNCQQRKVSE